MSESTKVRIVTDSACDLDDATVGANEISVVPLAIRFGDEEFIDRVELSNDDFWKRLGRSPELPSTAAPSSGAFEDVFREAKASGSGGVVCITISSKVSATYQAAVKGAEAVSGDIDVHVIDSLLCSAAEGSLVLEAAKLARAGHEAREIADIINERKTRTKFFAALDTLDNLRRGGRIGAASAFFGSLLSVKPIITFHDGEVHPESRQRTRRRATEQVVKLLADAGPVSDVLVIHSGAPDLDEFVNQVRAIVGDSADIPVFEIGPVIGTHGGPGILAISYVEKAPESVLPS